MSGQEIGHLPLEMCQTMNGMWGYKVSDTNYKSTDALVELIVRAAGKGSNLLLNIGPQPNGELPAASLDRLRGIGAWMEQFGESIYGTRRGPVEASWGVSTRKGEQLYLHVLDRTADRVALTLPRRPQAVTLFGGAPCTWHYDKTSQTLTLVLPDHADRVDLIVTIRE